MHQNQFMEEMRRKNKQNGIIDYLPRTSIKKGDLVQFKDRHGKNHIGVVVYKSRYNDQWCYKIRKKNGGHYMKYYKEIIRIVKERDDIVRWWEYLV